MFWLPSHAQEPGRTPKLSGVLRQVGKVILLQYPWRLIDGQASEGTQLLQVPRPLNTHKYRATSDIDRHNAQNPIRFMHHHERLFKPEFYDASKWLHHTSWKRFLPEPFLTCASTLVASFIGLWHTTYLSTFFGAGRPVHSTSLSTYIIR